MRKIEESLRERRFTLRALRPLRGRRHFDDALLERFYFSSGWLELPAMQSHSSPPSITHPGEPAPLRLLRPHRSLHFSVDLEPSVRFKIPTFRPKFSAEDLALGLI